MATSRKGRTKTTRANTARQITAATQHELDQATLGAAKLRAVWTWHYGRVAGMGNFSTAGGREVVLTWDEGGASRKQGGISDEQWEIFTLAFNGSGRISVLSDKSDPIQWMFDYRFLEAKSG